MPRTVEPPVFENLLAAGLAGGAAVLAPFAVAGIRASVSPHWPWVPSLVTAWTYLALFGWLAFRTRPLARSRKWFTFWYSFVLIQLVATVLFAHGFALRVLTGGQGMPTVSAEAAAVLLLFGLFGALPAVFLTALSDRGASLLVLQATAPLLVPVVFVLLAHLESLVRA